MNSVLSSEDEINRQMLQEFYKALKPSGKLCGFFPSIFWDLELAYLSKSHACWLTDGSINLAESAASIKGENYRQIYYTPLRLNRIFKEAGFKRHNWEIYFFDSPLLTTALKENEDEDPDICEWGFLVRYQK